MAARILLALTVLSGTAACATSGRSGTAASDLTLAILEQQTERPTRCTAPTRSFEPGANAPARQPLIGSAVLYDTAPTSAHTVIGEVAVQKGACGDQSTGTLLKLLKEHAGLHGCAGVILNPTTIEQTPEGRAQRVSGHCFVFGGPGPISSGR